MRLEDMQQQVLKRIKNENEEQRHTRLEDKQHRESKQVKN